eukprot:956897-Rhodomonas_salina.1
MSGTEMRILPSGMAVGARKTTGARSRGVWAYARATEGLYGATSRKGVCPRGRSSVTYCAKSKAIQRKHRTVCTRNVIDFAAGVWCYQDAWAPLVRGILQEPTQQIFLYQEPPGLGQCPPEYVCERLFTGKYAGEARGVNFDDTGPSPRP